MLREEAIKKLKWFREYNEDDFCGGDRIQDEYGDWYYRITEQDFETFDMAIKALEQEPRKGHWIDTNDDTFFYHRIYKCSHCGDVVCAYPENIQKYKYCPNCGANMKDEKEGNNEST